MVPNGNQGNDEEDVHGLAGATRSVIPQLQTDLGQIGERARHADVGRYGERGKRVNREERGHGEEGEDEKERDMR
jgi:hypothetical protein